METKKVLGIIFGSLAVLIFGFVLTWGIINFNKVKDGMSGTGLYTKEDLNNSYEDGYNTALMDKAEYEALISGYRDTITTQTDQISKLNSQITTLNNSNKDYKNQIQSLNNTITTNEETISNLQSLIDTNDITIAELETEIANKKSDINVLEKEITALQSANGNMTAEIQNKQNQVASLNNQVNSLQNLVNQLNATNETNLATINTLNNQIQSLNTQISDLKLQINSNDTNVADLNNQITDLQKSIAYYEQYIANLETDTQVVATFEFDGAVYNVQILNKGAYASVVAPTSTDYIVFNGWTVNNEIVDLNTYAINENTKFVADVTYNHDVKFNVDNVAVESQIVEKDTCAVMPTNPIKTGYSFDGWTVDGVNLVDVSTYKITANTTFTAVFTKMYNVTFIYEDTTISTQSIKNGAYAENVTVENSTYKVFNGWLVNGTTVDIATYKISADTVFVADITYKYDVIFTVDGEVYNSQIVTANNYALNPEMPVKEDYDFIGWSIDGVNVIDISTNVVKSNLTYVALFEKSSGGLFNSNTGEKIMTWKEMIDGNYLSVSDTGALSAGTNVKSLSGDLEISEDVKYFSSSVFRDCTGISSVVIPDNITSLPSYAFHGCSNLKNINLDNIKSYGVSCLAYTNLEVISLSENVTSISADSFAYINNLKVVNLNTSTSVNASAFKKSGQNYGFELNIGSSVINFPALNSEYGSSSAFCYVKSVNISQECSFDAIPNYAFYYCEKLESIKIPASVTSIGTSAFWNCKALKSVEFEANSLLTELGENVFGYTAISSISLPYGITSIKSKTFMYCKSLKHVTIPSSVTSLSGQAFGNCSSLESVYIPNSVVTAVGKTASYPFSQSYNCVIYMQASSAPSGFGTYWNYAHYTSSGTSSILTVKYGYTYERYLAEIGA